MNAESAEQQKIKGVNKRNSVVFYFDSNNILICVLRVRVRVRVRVTVRVRIRVMALVQVFEAF